MVPGGEGGLLAEPAAVHVEKDREFASRVGESGEEDPDGYGRVGGDDGVFGPDAGDGVVERWDFFGGGMEQLDSAVFVDSEEAKLVGYLFVSRGHCYELRVNERNSWVLDDDDDDDDEH